jgi:hypothetical protein
VVAVSAEARQDKRQTGALQLPAGKGAGIPGLVPWKLLWRSTGGSAFWSKTPQARAVGPERNARETTRRQPAREKVTRHLQVCQKEEVRSCLLEMTWGVRYKEDEKLLNISDSFQPPDDARPSGVV